MVILHGINNILKIAENGGFLILTWKDHMTVSMKNQKKLPWKQNAKSTGKMSTM